MREDINFGPPSATSSRGKTQETTVFSQRKRTKIETIIEIFKN